MELSADGHEIFFPSTVWDQLAESLQLGPRPADRKVNDLALFLACRTPEHVPGLWRTASPLGRDFVSIPAHQMIAFEAGAKPLAADGVPESIRATFDRRNGNNGDARNAHPSTICIVVDAVAFIASSSRKRGSGTRGFSRYACFP